VRNFIALINPSPRPGLNPRLLGPVARTLTTTPQRRLFVMTLILRLCTKLCNSIHRVSAFRVQDNFKISNTVKLIQIILVGKCIIFYSIKLNLSKCNGSWLVSVQQNVNFSSPHPSTFAILFFKKKFEFTVIHPLNIYQHAFCGPMLTASTLQPPQKF
jgi:hypothetical protein